MYYNAGVFGFAGAAHKKIRSWWTVHEVCSFLLGCWDRKEKRCTAEWLCSDVRFQCTMTVRCCTNVATLDEGGVDLGHGRIQGGW